MRKEEMMARMDAHRAWVQTAGKRGCQLDLDKYDLTTTDLTGFPFEQAYLTECRLNKLHLENVDFCGTELYSCDFSDTCFVGCSFRKAILDYCSFSRARFIRCQFPRTDAWQSCFSGCCFEDCSFVGINLMESDLSGTIMIRTDWEEAYLDRVNLHAAEGRASRNIATIIQPKICVTSAAEDWLSGLQAIQWLQTHMNQDR